MKYAVLIIFLLTIQNLACAQNQEQGTGYGDTFKVENVSNHWVLGVGEETQLRGKVISVCKAKGCWMNVDLADGNTVFVKFKDYGFFVPTDFEGTEIVMKGLAFVEQVSVEEQRHYAEDEGATEEEIKKITMPKEKYQFTASGVSVVSKN